MNLEAGLSRNDDKKGEEERSRNIDYFVLTNQ